MNSAEIDTLKKRAADALAEAQRYMGQLSTEFYFLENEVNSARVSTIQEQTADIEQQLKNI